MRPTPPSSPCASYISGYSPRAQPRPQQTTCHGHGGGPGGRSDRSPLSNRDILPTASLNRRGEHEMVKDKLTAPPEQVELAYEPEAHQKAHAGAIGMESTTSYNASSAIKKPESTRPKEPNKASSNSTAVSTTSTTA